MVPWRNDGMRFCVPLIRHPLNCHSTAHGSGGEIGSPIRYPARRRSAPLENRAYKSQIPHIYTLTRKVPVHSSLWPSPLQSFKHSYKKRDPLQNSQKPDQKPTTAQHDHPVYMYLYNHGIKRRIKNKRENETTQNNKSKTRGFIPPITQPATRIYIYQCLHGYINSSNTQR